MHHGIFHYLERVVHGLRGYLHPRMISSYCELRDRPLPEDASRRNLAVYDFHSIDIDKVMGRYLFHIVRDFMTLGYFPVYTSRFKFLASFHRKKYKQLLLETPLHTTAPNKLPERSFIYITDHPTRSPENAEQIIRVNYEHRRAKADHESEFPFFVHPEVSIQKDFPPRPGTLTERPIKLLFAGNTEERQYTKGNVKGKFGLIPRNEVVNLVKKHLSEGHVKEVSCEQDLLTPSAHIFQCVESDRYRIPADQWMSTLQRADFFLCCPGVSMPLCHNLIEALACGTIPILQYSHYMNPELINGENCLTYHDRPSLARAIDLAARMPVSALRIMRENALSYYHRYLSEGRFAEQILTSGTKETNLLLNAYRIPRAAGTNLTTSNKTTVSPSHTAPRTPSGSGHESRARKDLLRTSC
ncbi:hypothetical protein NT6N_28520 [Oceaniferula spumae]|uniref:Exostosin GT47 domain-containing protein n=1 Tax=Oceaniferula spumae TaxID=2979115 RepID=A0AAT9FPB2_9BACT